MIEEAVDCQTVVEMVTDWMEGALPPETRVEMELHIATCAGCIAYVEQLRATTAALAALDEDAPPSAEVRDELMAAFRRKAAGQSPSGSDPA